MKNLLKELAPLRNKIHIKIIISTVSAALTAGLTADAVLALISKFIYIYGVNNKIVIIFVSAISAGFVLGLLLRPSALKCAKTADALGGRERFITALEIIEGKKNGDMENSVIEDAESCAKKMSFKSKYSVKPHKYLLYGIFASALAFLLAVLIPIQPSERLEEQQTIHEKYDEAIKEMKSEVDSTNLTDKQKTQIKKELAKLKKELAKAQSKTEAADKLMKSQSQLKKITDESENASVKEIGTRLSENKNTQFLGEALKSGNIEDFNEQIKDLNEALKNMSHEELKELGEAFKKAAESNNIDSETKELLNELGDTLQNNLTSEQLASLSQTLNEFSDRINQLAKENCDLRDAIEKLNKDIARLDETSKANSDSQKQSNQTGEGRDGQTGEGQSGQVGGGRQGQSGANDNSKQSGRGKGSIANANIYTSEAKDYADYDAELNNNESANGQPNGKKVVNGADGKIIPYTDVFNDYKNEAMDSIDKEDIPYGVKDIVRDYFSSLE